MHVELGDMIIHWMICELGAWFLCGWEAALQLFVGWLLMILASYVILRIFDPQSLR